MPTLLIIGDSDIIRPERAVELFRLLGGVPGDIDGLPNSRLAVLPGTTHVTLGTWGALQPGDERKLGAAFIDTGDHVDAHWRLRAWTPARDEVLYMLMVGIYRLRDGKLVEAQMFYSDTAAVLRFLERVR